MQALILEHEGIILQGLAEIKPGAWTREIEWREAGDDEINRWGQRHQPQYDQRWPHQPPVKPAAVFIKGPDGDHSDLHACLAQIGNRCLLRLFHGFFGTHLTGSDFFDGLVDFVTHLREDGYRAVLHVV